MPLDSQFLRLAEQFLEFITRETGFAMIVCDETAKIVRATVRTRVGSTHAGAQRILRCEVEEAAVTAEEAAANPQVREGYSCPIVVDGRRVATFGITGPLQTTRPLARVAAVVLATWIKGMHQERALHEAASRLFTGLDDLARRVDGAAAFARQTAEELASAAGEAVEKAAEAQTVVAQVQRIAQETRILSINGAVEAARAGDRGHSFAVVAKGMTHLADETRKTSNQINRTIGEAALAMGRVRETVGRSTENAAEQARMVRDVMETVLVLKDLMGGLENAFATQGEGKGMSQTPRSERKPGTP